MANRVPVLITCDIDPTPEVSLENKQEAISLTIDLFKKHRVKSTLFFVAHVAQFLGKEICDLILEGHEIGCHGLSHSLDEDYTSLPEPIQKKNLYEATNMLNNLAGSPIKSFRGPRVETSHITQKILAELNYSADCSVCSQRIDVISSNLINKGWIFAPRVPYNPSTRNAFQKGMSNILVVPVSALIVPFISGALYVLGLSFMKLLFGLLYSESKKTGKPIVYLMHAFEFGMPYTKGAKKGSRLKGWGGRRKLKTRLNSDEKFKLTDKLLRYIRRYNSVRLMTVSEFVDFFENK